MYQKISLTESAPGNTTKQNGSFLGPIKISWASGRVQVEPHWGGIRVSGSISSAVATGVQVLRDHSFKTSANFTIFDLYPPTIGISAKCLWRGFLILIYCDILTIGPWGHPSPLRHADVLNEWYLSWIWSFRSPVGIPPYPLIKSIKVFDNIGVFKLVLQGRNHKKI